MQAVSKYRSTAVQHHFIPPPPPSESSGIFYCKNDVRLLHRDKLFMSYLLQNCTPGKLISHRQKVFIKHDKCRPIFIVFLNWS